MLLLVLGFLFGITSTEAEYTHQTKTDTTAVTDTTQLLTINRVLIIGNKKTRDQIISRELSLKQGDTISSHRLAETLIWDKRKIYNLRLFNTVSIRSLEISSTTIDLLVEVEERWYTWPSPIFELSDRNFNEWWQNYNHDLGRINFGIRLDQFNVRGRNETLRLTAQFGFNQKFELSYTIPYLDKKQKQGLIINFDYSNPKNLSAATQDHVLFYIRKNEPLRISTSAQLTYTYRKTFYQTHSLSVGYHNTKIADTISLENSNYFIGSNQQNYTSIAYSFRSEHRDVVMYPLKGYQFSGFIQRNGLGFDGNVDQWLINLTYAYHQDLKKGYFLSNFTSAYLSDPTTQPYSLYGALGYQRQIVRGYEIYVIEGPKFFVNKTTFKKRIFSKVWRYEAMPLEQFRHLPFAVYLKGFVDMGYVQNYPYYSERGFNTRLTDTFLSGYGTGVDIVIPYDIVIRVEYTATRQGTQGFFINLKKEF